ncbi:MAG: MlaA family lipoprotein [Methyloceanibacter sp.]
MMVKAFSILGRAAGIALAAALSACAAGGTPMPSPELLASHNPSVEPKDTQAALDAPKDVASLPDEPQEVSDPLERMNRSTFERNQHFNHAVVYPVANAYHNSVPEPVRNSVEAFASNLSEPMVFATDVVQLRLGAAATTLGRFAVNSTFGVAGLFDVATRQNLPHQSGDLGQTLYVLGMRDSPYLVLPVIGPTNIRDLIGTTVEFAATLPAGGVLPAQIAATVNDLTVVGTVASPFTKLGQADQMQELEEGSIDFYSMLRSVVYQKRQAELQEALETSGWTAHPAGSFEGPGTASATTASLLHVPVPATKEQELVANALQGGQ